jgi:hypothetical protein
VPKIRHTLFLLVLAFITPLSYAGYYQGDGSIVSTVEINSDTNNGPTLTNSDNYGYSPTNLGDLDGDGVSDIAVGAPFDDEGGSNRGAVHIHFMNTDGSIDSTVEINSSTTNGPTLSDSDYYGKSVANIGDLNGDGVQDLAVGAVGDDEGGSNYGALHIHFMDTDGTPKSTVEINDNTTNGPTLSEFAGYGSSVADLGDLNGDGVTDLIVGAYANSVGCSYCGATHIHFMNTDGSMDSTIEINGTTDNGPALLDLDLYGISIANIGDLNGDGVDDIVVGANSDDEGGSSRGAVHISFLNTDGSVDSTVEINDTTDNGPTLANDDNYGRSVANLGDLNGDGVNDIAVGSIGDDTGGGGRGAFYIHFMYGEYIDTASSGTGDSTITDKRHKRTGDRCYVEAPPALTWITLEPMTVDDVLGMQVRWTQYGANKMTIKIDDGTGNYPWRLDKISNDGHEFLPNVQVWQNIKLKPAYECAQGSYSTPVSYSSYPNGWYNE